MIPIEEQVTSLHWSKELVKRGIKIDSVWWWVVKDGEKPRLELYNTGFSEEYEMIPAPTSVELGEMLPPYIYKKWDKTDKDYVGIENEKAILICNKLSAPLNAWTCDYCIYRGEAFPKQYILFQSFKDAREADARAKMLYWLKDWGYFR